jgi:hypothetical protein
MWENIGLSIPSISNGNEIELQNPNVTLFHTMMMNHIPHFHTIVFSFKFYPPNTYKLGGDMSIINHVLGDIGRKLLARKYQQVTCMEIW